MSTSPEMKTYRVTEDGWLKGHRVTKGQEVQLTLAQAKYERNLELMPEDPAPKKGTAKKS